VGRFVWILTWAAIAVWSLLAWGAYGLLDLVGGLAAGGAGAVALDPGVSSVVVWIVNLVKGLGLFAVLAVWGFVSVVMLAFGWVLSKALGGPGARVDVSYYQRSVHPPQGYPPGAYPGPPGGMRDVTPTRTTPEFPRRLDGPGR
jgi:hypothetical protein